jgi:DNA invertase Pin-like site-specific DNA recombinase
MRQAAGIAAAGANGKTWGGRKRGSYKVDPACERKLADKGFGKGEMVTVLGVSRRTVSRMLAMV